jgi:type IV secretory pathway VirB3-like protein
MARESYDASMVNRPRLIGGVPWEMAVGLLGFFGYAAFMMRAPLYLLPGVLMLLLLRSAAKRDHLFLQIYRRYRVQAEIYSPAPVVGVQQSQRRPRGYGRYDPN